MRHARRARQALRELSDAVRTSEAYAEEVRPAAQRLRASRESRQRGLTTPAPPTHGLTPACAPSRPGRPRQCPSSCPFSSIQVRPVGGSRPWHTPGLSCACAAGRAAGLSCACACGRIQRACALGINPKKQTNYTCVCRTYPPEDEELVGLLSAAIAACSGHSATGAQVCVRVSVWVRVKLVCGAGGWGMLAGGLGAWMHAC